MSLNSLDGFSNRIDGGISNLSNKASSVTSAVDQVQNNAANAVNRVQGSIDSAQRGVENVSNLYNNTVDKAGETYDKIANGVSGLTSKVGNLFGGGDMATTNAVKAPGSAESGTSPASRIAGFANDPKETLPSIDPLKREVSEPFKAANETANGVLDYLKPGKAGSLLSQGFTKLTNLRDGALKSLGTDYASVKGRIESTMKLAGQISRLPGDIQAEVSSYVSAVNQARNEVTAVIGDATRTFNSLKDFDNYLAIDNVIESFKTNFGGSSGGGYGSSGFTNFDIGTTSGLIYGLSSKLSEYGMPERTSEMVDVITDPVAKRAMYGELMVQAARTGNLDSVEYYLTKLDTGQGLEIGNDVIQALLSNLQINQDLGMKTYGTRIVALCNALDPNWDKTKTAPILTDLTNYSYCNNNSIQALLTTAKRIYVCAAGNRRTQSADVLVAQFFPS